MFKYKILIPGLYQSARFIHSRLKMKRISLIDLTIVVLLVLLVKSQISDADWYDGTIQAYVPYTGYNFTLPIENLTHIRFVFSTYPAINNVLMVVSMESISHDLNPMMVSTMYRQQDKFLQRMDLEGALSDKIQIVRITLPQNYLDRTIYVRFFNFDLPEVAIAKDYNLYIFYFDSDQNICRSCPGYTEGMNNQTCQCYPCRENTYGTACQNHVQPMEEGTVLTPTFAGLQNIHYRIANPAEKIRIYFSQKSKIQKKIKIFIQYEIKEGDLAGKLSTYYQNGKPLSRYISDEQKYIQLTPQGRNIAITVQSQSDTKSTNVQIWYENVQESRLALILGLALGIPALLLLGLLAFCCIRRKINRQRKIQDDSVNALSQDQIILYFPVLWGHQFFQIYEANEKTKTKIKHEQTDEALNPSESSSAHTQAISSLKCSFCKEQLVEESKVRVTYCGHIFHSKCLKDEMVKEWRCPQCHHDCSRNETIRAYEELKGDRKKYSRKQLVKDILASNNEQKEGVNPETHVPQQNECLSPQRRGKVILKKIENPPQFPQYSIQDELPR